MPDSLISENYDRYLGPFLFEPFALDLVNRIAGKNYENVLELACGTGRVTRHLRRVLPQAKIVATDSQSDMIRVASQQLPDDNIQWQTADAQQLAFADQGFNLIICQFGLMFMRDRSKVLSEVFRVLKPSGKFIFNTWDKIENNGAIHLGNQIICSYFPEHPPTNYRLPFMLHQPDLLETNLLASGFKNIKASAVEKEGVSPSAKDAAIGIVEGNPIYNLIVQKDPNLVDVIRSAVEQKIAEAYGDHPLKTPLRAWVLEAQK